ncbi:MarR family winged helix-turn-helix transcriptional regulator [Nonomuraea sp. NPDC055795]
MSSEQAGSVGPGDPPHPVSAVDLADEFGRTAKLLGGRLTSRLTGHDLSMPRANLLVALIRYGPQRVTQLGNQIGVTQGTASALVDALVRDGLLERCTDPLDGRATRLAVTDIGRERAQAWLHDYELAAAEVFETLSLQQRSALLEALRILSAAESPSDA